MYIILIVDDEKIICDSLFNFIRQINEVNFEIYRAYSYVAEESILNSIKLDILVTDISMPGKSGLKLSDITVKKWPACRVIYLTGHENFDYAYKACLLYTSDAADDL